MNWFDRIDSPSGHIVVCLVLLLVGCWMYKSGIPRGEVVIDGAGAVLFAAMRGAWKQAQIQAEQSLGEKHVTVTEVNK